MTVHCAQSFISLYMHMIMMSSTCAIQQAISELAMRYVNMRRLLCAVQFKYPVDPRYQTYRRSPSIIVLSFVY